MANDGNSMQLDSDGWRGKMASMTPWQWMVQWLLND
jgi:hypothetical protein